ncbi:MAG: hypothetical protein QME58_03070 [Bacteroidota bacterium]|nr:hypothetical protein [Bacteroidota bacterium]
MSLVLTPAIISLAKYAGAMDIPNERKVHKFPIPRLGGLAIYLSFFISLVLCIYFNPTINFINPSTGIMLLVSLTLVLILGIWDDIKQISPGKKFIGQWLAATLVYLAGFRISAITSPFDLELMNLGIFDYPATILWIVGITNAFNLIDGLDGLASGIALIASITMFSLSLLRDDLTSSFLSLLLIGATLGFLRYNFNKAKIFLGDSGSLFIGFALAILSMMSTTKGSTAFSIIVPILILGLPIMDTLLSMLRRSMRSIVGDYEDSRPFIKKVVSIFYPDKGHVHHRLMSFGISDRKVVIILYVVSIIFSVGAFAITIANTIIAIPILIIIGLATFLGVSQLGYKEMALLRNGTLLPIYEKPFFKSSLFHGFLDLVSISLAFGITYYLTSIIYQADFLYDKSFYKDLAIISGTQFSILFFGGIYKLTMKQLGLGDLLKILKAIIVAVFFTWLIFSIAHQSFSYLNLSFLLLNFYLLTTFVLGGRLLFNILNYLSHNDDPNGRKKVLVYGAGADGLKIIEQITKNSFYNIFPVGLLDDDPHLLGKRINGFKILGSHWNLPQILKTIAVDEILYFNDNIQQEVIKRLVKIANAHRIKIRYPKIGIEELQSYNVNSKYNQQIFTFDKSESSMQNMMH